MWESEQESDLVLVDAIEGGPIRNADRQPEPFQELDVSLLIGTLMVRAMPALMAETFAAYPLVITAPTAVAQCVQAGPRPGRADRLTPSIATPPHALCPVMRSGPGVCWGLRPRISGSLL